jgi:predicted heme/steroid binding protein
MASLTGQTIASTYDALLKITDNGAITSSLKQITDGLGNNTPLFLSATTLYVNGNLRAGGALYDGNNEPGTNGQFLVSTGTGVDWQNIAESGLITGSGTNGFISKFTASGVIANSVIQESSSNIGIGISPTQKLHVSGNGLFTGTLTASNLSGSNTGDESKATIESKLGAATSSNAGYLTAANWSTFNAKQNQLDGTGFIKATGTTITYDNSVYALESRAINTTAPLSGGGNLSTNRTLSIARADAVTDGYLAADDFTNFNSKVPAARTISINGETFDLSANRTYSVNVGVTSFNTRTGAVVLGSGDVTTALGYTPALNSRIMTINGVGYDLSADRTWSVGTVTSVGTSAPLTGGTITSTGTIGITQSGASANGYLSSTDWNTFNNKQAALGFTPENSANKGANNGYASLDGAGKVPSGQLPSYVDDVVEVANYAALPATGETGKIYITLDTNFVYRWSGTVYVKISEPNAVWGSITGTLSNQTDLQSALNAKVDNTRTITINGTASDLSANRTFNVGTVTSVSGTGSVSGLSLSGSVTSSGSLTLGGTLSLTSGDVTTGLGYTPVTNARTLSINGTVLDLTANRSWSVGTVTSVGLDLGTTGTDLSVANSPITSSGNITLNIPTASAANRGVLSSTDWSTFNSKQNTLTLTTTGSSGASTLVGATLNIPTYTLSGLGGQPLLTNPVTGTGTSGYLTRFTGSTTVGNSVIFDNGTQVGIGTASPSYLLHVKGSSIYNGAIFADNSSATGAGSFQVGQNGTAKGSLSLSGTFNGDTSSDISLFADTGFGARFYTNGVNERMRITSSGNVGIGTTSPNAKLEVYNNVNSGSGIRITNINGGSGTGAATYYHNGNVIHEVGVLGSGYTAYGVLAANELYLYSGNSNVSFAADGASSSIKFGTGSGVPERMRITSAGNVGIGTSSPSYQLQLSTDSAAKPTSALWTIASDLRIKENITPYAKGLKELMLINPINYDYNGLGGFKKGKGGVGIIAQEILNILPDSVSSVKGKLNEGDKEETDILNFNGHELTYVLINAIKELKAELDELKNNK